MPPNKHLQLPKARLSAPAAAPYLWLSGLRGGRRVAPLQLKCGPLGGRESKTRWVFSASHFSLVNNLLRKFARCGPPLSCVFTKSVRCCRRL